MPQRPIRVFYSELDERFYASSTYQDLGGGKFRITGQKFDVTNDIARSVLRYDVDFIKVEGDPEA